MQLCSLFCNCAVLQQWIFATLQLCNLHFATCYLVDRPVLYLWHFGQLAYSNIGLPFCTNMKPPWVRNSVKMNYKKLSRDHIFCSNIFSSHKVCLKIAKDFYASVNHKPLVLPQVRWMLILKMFTHVPNILCKKCLLRSNLTLNISPSHVQYDNE